MSIFKKNEPAPPKPRERPTAAPRIHPAGDGAISIIAAGMEVVGDISTEGTVRVEGHVRGVVRAGKTVVLGQGGRIEGSVVTSEAVIGGTVDGLIIAESRLELQATCTVKGEIRTRAEHLKLEEGARFAGQVHILEETIEATPEPLQLSAATPALGTAVPAPRTESPAAEPTPALPNEVPLSDPPATPPSHSSQDVFEIASEEVADDQEGAGEAGETGDLRERAESSR